jgi:hypothetical protein
MRKHRVTNAYNFQSDKLPELLPITAMSSDHRATIFRRSRSRSLNSPELALAHESLTQWLNGENSGENIYPSYRNSPESTQRILKLFKLVRDVTTTFEQKAPVMYPYFYGKAAAPSRIEEKDHTVQFDIISRALVDYATVPYLAFQPSTKLWGLGHWPVGLPDVAYYGPMEVQPTLRPYGEVLAAHGILELARRRALSRIRECDCGDWYFAKREDGVACSDTCRKRIHDRKPEAIERRRKKAKEYADFRSGKNFLEKRKMTNRAARETKKTRIEKVKGNG